MKVMKISLSDAKAHINDENARVLGKHVIN